MHILGLDLGTVCGAADGPPGGKPNIWTWNMKDAGEGDAAKFALWQVWLESYFRTKLHPEGFADYPINPDDFHIYYEQPLTLGAILSMSQSKAGLQTNDAQLDMARGYVGVLKAVAFNAGVRVIEAVDAHTARKALTKDGNATKKTVAEYCRILGWDTVVNDNESDACCIWNYGWTLSNPRLAHLSTPLFGSR